MGSVVVIVYGSEPQLQELILALQSSYLHKEMFGSFYEKRAIRRGSRDSQTPTFFPVTFSSCWSDDFLLDARSWKATVPVVAFKSPTIHVTLG